MSIQPGLLQFDDLPKWEGNQVYPEYPKMSGGLTPLSDIILTSTFGKPAPNMSIIIEKFKGSFGKDGLPIGCYGSILDNHSDATFLPVEYPVVDYNKVDPVQVLHEGQLSILTNYKVDEVNKIIYADLLQSSLKSFDRIIWSIIFLSILAFSVLLLMRKLVHSIKNQGYSPLFETFSHMIRQETTDFSDRSGRLISMIMTFGFFFLLAFYLNLMSTDLVVVTKPKVVNTYRDVMNIENVTVSFYSMTYDISEFENAEKGSIQEEFWNMFKDSYMTIDLQENMEGITNAETMKKALDGKLIALLSSLYSHALVKQGCKMKVIMQKDMPMLSRMFFWIPNDPEGKQHTTGLILRQGLKSDLIRKGKRRLRGLFEGDVIKKLIADVIDTIDFGPMSEGTASISEIMKCMSKTVNYNHPEVEKVNPRNFRYLALLCAFLFFKALIALVSEIVHKMMTITRVISL